MDNISYGSDGTTALISQQNKYTVKGGGNFRGEGGLTELSGDITSSYTSATANGPLAGTTVGPVNVKTYYKISGADSLNYGLVSTSSSFGFSFSVTSFYTPAWGFPTQPTLNVPYTRSYTVTTEATATVPGSSLAQSTTVTYLGVEQVSVLAGTFAACKTRLETTSSGQTTVTYNWIVAAGRLKGHTLKTEDASGKKILEAKVLLLNGS